MFEKSKSCVNSCSTLSMNGYFSAGPLEMYSPIFMLSSFSDVEYKKRATDSGVAGFGRIPIRSSSEIHSLSRELSLNAVAACAIRLCVENY